MKVGAVVLARLDSRRLPGKALLELNGRPLIQYAFDACAATAGIDVTVLATSDRAEDDPLAAYAEAHGIGCFRGDLDDVAGRFLGALEFYNLDGALRFNGDSPLNRPALLGRAVSVFRGGDWDLVTNVPGRTFPFGISVEVVGASIMKAACAAMTDNLHREHVTKFFYDMPQFARTFHIVNELQGMTGLQLAVDDVADMERVGWILRRLPAPLSDVSLAQIVECAQQYDRGLNR
ncbi:cytidylyltransferase domain-containing protein [Rhodopseudomonas sp. RCAM05734]|uniref:cytidylyltransferase domain-containing protein n=1 Tax=Rhodopseudomonas sp. RCAM05734 TaxID=3457549 RepID=UPI0040448445